MLFMTSYRVIGERTPDRTAALMEVFGERGEAEGTQAHYVRADGRGGWLIQDLEEAGAAYEDSLAYAQWLEIETVPMLMIDDAVPRILASIS